MRPGEVERRRRQLTAHDAANVVIACGGSPFMSDEPRDVEDITCICGALDVNIGTLNMRSIEAMDLAAIRAAELDRPIVLDPVGAGASALRADAAVAARDAAVL